MNHIILALEPTALNINQFNATHLLYVIILYGQ